MEKIAPFKLVETSEGNHSLLLSEFEPATAVFEKHGLQGGGYSWEGVARHLLEAGDLGERVGLDPEGSMFCAYGTDREALVSLGESLAAAFHDPARLEAIIEAIGPEGFDD